MVSIAYLWKRKQDELLQEMIDNKMEAILIKTAVIGLEPEKHLGKTIKEMYPYLIELVSLLTWFQS
jgi:diphthine-ammonia ligase